MVELEQQIKCRMSGRNKFRGLLRTFRSYLNLHASLDWAAKKLQYSTVYVSQDIFNKTASKHKYFHLPSYQVDLIVSLNICLFSKDFLHSKRLQIYFFFSPSEATLTLGNSHCLALCTTGLNTLPHSDILWRSLNFYIFYVLLITIC